MVIALFPNSIPCSSFFYTYSPIILIEVPYNPSNSAYGEQIYVEFSEF